MLHVVLVEPEIPQNTGNILRTCAATDSKLHLVRPLGFSLEDRYLKRAGLDYWEIAQIQVWNNLEDVKEAFFDARYFYATTKAKKAYSQVAYSPKDMLVFGSETRGLPNELIEKNHDYCIRIPMSKQIQARSLNLSNAAAVVMYEALRQLGFPKLH